MGKASRDKGARGERKVVNALKDMGVESKRVPLSGASGGIFSGDLLTYLPMIDPDYPRTNHLVLRGEVKWRKNAEGFKQINAWLGKNELLFLLQDRKDPLVVLPWKTFNALFGGVKVGPADEDSEQRGDDSVPGSLDWAKAAIKK